MKSLCNFYFRNVMFGKLVIVVDFLNFFEIFYLKYYKCGFNVIYYVKVVFLRIVFWFLLYFGVLGV